MNDDYGSYLVVIILLILVIAACFILAFYSRRKRPGRGKKPLGVDGGNISVFFDRAGNAILIPYVKDKYGSGRATSRVATVKTPYPPEKLGYAVKTSLNGCKNGAPCTNRQLLDILEADDWMQFSEGKRNISVYFREGYGLVFNTTVRKPDGAYQFNVNGIEKAAPADVADEALGNLLLQLLVKCR